jgi:hypothetical protein
MIKSASQYISYENLKWIKENNYISKQGVEYCPEEIDAEIYSKMTKIDEQKTQELLKRWE